MSKHVVICDDDIHILRAAEIKLKRGGIDVTCANDGQEGWEAIQQRCPDLLVTDCQMPRLNGFGLVQKVRENPQTQHLPVLMLTAKGYELVHQDCTEQYGILAILAKPFSPRELLRLVQNALEHGSIQDQEETTLPV